MSDLVKLSRVVCSHRWTAVEEWADCLRRLGDLSDDELGLLAAVQSPPQHCASRAPLRRTAGARSGKPSRR